MNGLDLFSGIGGITKALEAYVRPVAYCENDRYAQSVLLSRMADGDLPQAPIWDDVRTLKGDMLPPIDIIYGGFPCQDISAAGRGAGLEGERSGLFFEIVRLCGEIRPQFVFLENVAAITVRGAERVIGEFCKLRYDCRWGILSASDVGANHRRDRWWLLAYAMSSRERREQRKEEVEGNDVADTNGIGSDKCPKKCVLESKVTKDCVEERDRGTSEDRGHSWWSVEPDVGRVAHGVQFRMDRLKGLGNAVVPQQAREAFERLTGIKRGGQR